MLKLPLFVASRPSDIVVSNYFLGEFEADLLRINERGMVWEYELKASLSDFRADFKKERYGNNKHERLKDGKHTSNYFSFVAPEGMIPLEEVPAYAGLIVYSVTESGFLDLRVSRHPKKLHKRPFEDFRNVAMKLAFRDYNTRRTSIFKCLNAIDRRKRRRTEQ